MSNINRFEMAVRYKVWRWVENNQELVMTNTDDSVARMCEQELGITITAKHIKNARAGLGMQKRTIVRKDVSNANELKSICNVLISLFKDELSFEQASAKLSEIRDEL